MYNTAFVAIDLEMEQLSREILSLGIAISVPRQPGLICSNNFFITPSQPVSEYIQNLTGITDSDFDHSKSRGECYKLAQAWLHDQISILKANNIVVHPEFVVWGIGDVEALRADMTGPLTMVGSRRTIDVKTLAAVRYYEQRGKFPSNMSLQGALKYFRVDTDGVAHNSESDARNTLKLLNQLLDTQLQIRENISSLRKFLNP